MYHPPSKRTEFWRRTLTYSAMVFAILGLVTVLVFVILGYRFNGDDGKIEQGGLVQFASQPGGATITLDGMPFGARTTAKTTMAAGTHHVVMNRTGYQEWRKTVSVVPGAVLWLNYARLIPKELPVESVASLPAVSSSATASNKEWIILATDPALPELQLANIRETEPTITKLTLPQELYTAPASGKMQHFTVTEWDKDSRYVLIKHTIEGVERTEWLLIDTRAIAESKNVTRLLNIDSSEMRFSRTGSQALYTLTAGDVRKIDLGAGTLSRPLVSNVAEFDLYRDTGIVYVTKPQSETQQRSVGYALDSEEAPRTLRAFNGDGAVPLRIAIGEYFDDIYVAIAHGSTVSVVTGELPKDATDLDTMQHVASMKLSTPVNRLTILTDGRFVVAEMNDAYAVYDLEIKRETVTALKGAPADTVRKLQWIDGYMPWSDRDGKLRLYEFDGANQHDIMPVVAGQTVTLSRNGTYLYSIGKSADTDTYQLQRVRLILP